MPTLTLVDADGNPEASCPLGREPIYVGRSGTNDLVLDRRSVSGRHLAVWVARGRVWVEDLGSRNGTFRANGKRVRVATAIPDGEVIRLGSDVRLRVEGTPAVGDAPVPMVCLVDGSASFPLHGSRFRIGSDPDADLVLADAEPTTITVHPTGELWLGRADAEGPLEWGEPFTVGPHELVVRGSRVAVSATWDVELDRYGYALQVAIDGPHGAQAVVTDAATGHRHEVTAPNRAVYLYLLARRLLEDRERGEPVTHRGWIPDAEVASGVWGRAGENKNLNVLVTRVRKELEAAGFDPWFIEKRRGHSRLQLDDVTLG